MHRPGGIMGTVALTGLIALIAARGAVAAEEPAAPERPLLMAYYEPGKHGEIIALRADGSGLQNLTTNPRHTDNYPSWSPDGKRIAFNSHRSGGWAIWVMNADGSDPRRLARTHNRTLNPSWSPDGKQVTFFGDFGGYWNIGIVNADGTGLRQLTREKAIARDPSFSPDGASILFFSSREGGVCDLWTIRPDGKGLTNVTETPDQHEVAAAWSPDGREIACYEIPDSLDVLEGSIVVMNEDGSERRTLAPVRGARGIDYREARLTWTADGRHVVYVTYEGSRAGLLYQVPSDGSESPRRLTRLPGTLRDPAWQAPPQP